MLELAGGNFNVALPGLGRKDEIGDVANAVETFKIKAEEKARSELEARRNPVTASCRNSTPRSAELSGGATGRLQPTCATR